MVLLKFECGLLGYYIGNASVCLDETQEEIGGEVHILFMFYSSIFHAKYLTSNPVSAVVELPALGQDVRHCGC